MPFTIVRQDITKMKVDVIVNAANTDLLMGGGVCGAIFKAAGKGELQAACNRLAPIKTGETVITPGFGLGAKYIIHAAGPIYRQWSKEESEELLRLAYLNALRLAVEKKCTSIAFPLISSGIYGYPPEGALQVAISTIQEFLLENDLDVYLTVFDMTSYQVSEELLGKVKSYIDENYVDEHLIKRYALLEEKPPGSSDGEAVKYGVSHKYKDIESSADTIDELVDNLDEPFSTFLLRLIDAKGKTDVEVYKRANLDRKLFSKIRTVKGYMPSKRTVLALVIALELTLKETDDLLARAGFALSHSQKFDVIIEYFIINGKYDIFEINSVLFQYDQPLLGG